MRLLSFFGKKRQPGLTPAQILKRLVEYIPDFYKTHRQYGYCVEFLDRHEWGLALDSLIELAEETGHYFPDEHWKGLIDAAVTMGLNQQADYCRKQLWRNEYDLETEIPLGWTRGRSEEGYALRKSMAFLDEPLQRTIDALRKRSHTVPPGEAIQLMLEAWSMLPEPKVKVYESFPIVKRLAGSYIQAHNVAEAKKWLEVLYSCNTEKTDNGDPEFIAGKIAYEIADFDTARSHFRIAKRKSSGECFSDENPMYKALISSYRKKTLGLSVVMLTSIIVFALLAYSFFIAVGDGSLANDVLPVLFVIGLLLFPLTWGLQLWRNGVWRLPQGPGWQSAFGGDTVIKIQSKVTLPEYRRLMFQLAYTRPVFIYIHFLALFILLVLPGPLESWITIMTTLLMLYLPVAIYRRANLTYKSTKMLHETISYTITPVTMAITGESVSYNIYWIALKKFGETKHWMLLYPNKHVAMLIPKKAFASHADMEAVRAMARILPV